MARIELLEPRRVLDSTVVFSEIMYHSPADQTGQLEWIELQNQLTVDMDVSDWRLTGGVEYAFPDGTVIPGRGQLVVAGSPETVQTRTGLPHVEGPWSGRLANSGELLQLVNNDDRLMNAVEYDDRGDWPEAPDGSGFSLAKSRQLTASHRPENWSFSSELGGTPGRPNNVEPGSVTTETLLAERTMVRALVPADDRLRLDWTRRDFDDSTWTRGITGVGYDSGSAYAEFIGLDLNQPPAGQAPIPMKDINASVYIRVPFEIAADLSEFDYLELHMRFDDGFVAYLNGVEIAHANAPGRSGNDSPLLWSSTATRSRTAKSKSRFDMTEHRDLLQPGANVLAIQGLNRRASNNVLLMQPSIVGKKHTLPAVRSPLAINELEAAGTEAFFVEIVNTGDHPVELSGARLTSTGATDQFYAFSEKTLPPNGMVVATNSDLGFPVAAGDLLLLTSPDGQVLFDGRRITDRLRGRSVERQGVWYFPSGATPAAPNQFAWNTDIVINEIMYHAAAQAAIHTRPPVLRRTAILSMDSDQWIYNQTGTDLGSDWASSTYAANNVDWFSGRALIGFDTAEFPVPVHTQLIPPRENDPPVLTYYFQATFDVSAAQLKAETQLELMHFVDTGAIFYLNGSEIHRIRMPAEDVDSETTATGFVGDATAEGPFLIPRMALVPGRNILSAEIHRRSAGGKDVMFGASVSLTSVVESATASRPFVESDEEWIELYNGGEFSIDVGGWQVSNAIRFELPQPTIIDPGQYVVVAKDAAALSIKYPDIVIVGDFRGSLSNHDDIVRLLDANDNLVDEVHYFEGGRWPEAADGGGSSLELSDPRSDNASAEAWWASDESGKSTWITYSHRELAAPDVTDQSAIFNEFFFGLLDAGEFLIDDITVTRYGHNETTQLIQNGTFEGDTLGESPVKWRIIGNHSGHVVEDPDNPNNQVLHVVATGSQAHVHDHAETTFVDDLTLWDGFEYEISFRAKWLTGNSQVNSRLYFNRVASTAVLDVPQKTGTPGRLNSVWEQNTGPTFERLQHQPRIPTETQDVTVSVQVADPDSIDVVNLHWRTDGEDANWTIVPMTISESGIYESSIPAHEVGTVVQFFVRARDGLGLHSVFPAGGVDSCALYQVEDGKKPVTEIDRLRMVQLEADTDNLFARVDRMSNRFWPITLYHNDEVFYDVSVRLVGSGFIRPNSGYKVKLHPDKAFYGVHDSVRFDLNGIAEIVLKQMINRAGGSQTSAYDDIAYLVSPISSHTHEVLLNLARYESIYLDEQFDNGGDGTKWELDVITYPIRPSEKIPCPDDPGRTCFDRESLKSDTGFNSSVDIAVDTETFLRRGNNPEFHRGQLLIKNNRVKDDFAPIVKLARAIHFEGDELFAATNEIMDVDLWMRHYANQAYLGNWDTYGFGRAKNLRIYLRPSDERFIPLFWDCDLCGFVAPLVMVTDSLSRLDEIRDIPHNLRLYWGHMLDYVNRSFNEPYVARWAKHYGELANDATFSDLADLTQQRNEGVLKTVEEAIPQVAFTVTTDNGMHTDQDRALIRGKGWVNVREIRLSVSQQPLNVFWPETDTWQVEVPLSQGENDLTFDAIDFDGNLIGSATVNVISDALHPAFNHLRVSEVHYHPAEPTAAEVEAGHTDKDEFEFLELMNVGDGMLELSSIQLTQFTIDGETEGLYFDFGTGSADRLAPGQRVVVVEDLEAFRTRYGHAIPVAGQWSGGLSNRGEMITVSRAGKTVQQFTYDAAWYAPTDGQGFSLEIRNPEQDLSLWNQMQGWQPGTVTGGTPANLIAGDLDLDGEVTSHDIDILTAQIGEASDSTAFDLTGDGEVDNLDLEELVLNILDTRYGDTNLDGAVDQTDFESLARNFGAQTGQHWSDGDNDGDGDVDFADFTRLSNSFGRERQ